MMTLTTVVSGQYQEVFILLQQTQVKEKQVVGASDRRRAHKVSC